MRTLLTKELCQITGAIVSLSGFYTTWGSNVSFGSGFEATVTSYSHCKLGSIEFQANKVINKTSGAILFDGSNDDFCINGASFKATSVDGGWFSYFFGNGHTYKCTGNC